MALLLTVRCKPSYMRYKKKGQARNEPALARTHDSPFLI
jgi:hypothetical protein